MSTTLDTPVPADATEPQLSPIERAIAVFIRPTQAWTGLRERAQWWFPFLIMLVLSLVVTLALYQRAVVPMMSEQWDEAVANRQMSAEQEDKMLEGMSGPVGMAISGVIQAVGYGIGVLVSALLLYFAVGFVLGGKLPYRLALEVVTWSSLIQIPSLLLTAALAWAKQSFLGVHLGFGLLLPDGSMPNRLHLALGRFLDSLGPLSIWYLVVGIIGASTLSGVPRRNVAWTLAVLYVAFQVLIAAISWLSTPGS